RGSRRHPGTDLPSQFLGTGSQAPAEERANAATKGGDKQRAEERGECLPLQRRTQKGGQDCHGSREQTQTNGEQVRSRQPLLQLFQFVFRDRVRPQLPPWSDTDQLFLDLLLGGQGDLFTTSTR